MAVAYLLTAIALLLTLGVNNYNSIVYFIGAILLVLYSSYYLFTFFKTPVATSLLYAPAFWLACGILLYYSATIPLVIPWPFLLNCTPFELKVLHIILTFINCSSYLLFAAGFVAHIKNKRV